MKGIIQRCLKNLRRYGRLDNLTPKLWEEILLLALKGCSCDKQHLDYAQRTSLYDFLKDKEFDDPYLLQFMKECKEIINAVDL